MCRTRLMAFLPPLTLLITALLVRGIRSVVQAPDSVMPTPVVWVVSNTDDPATDRLRKELKTTLQRYARLQGAAQERATYSVGRTPSTEFINRRIAILRAWPDFTVMNIEKRRSGLVVAQLEYDGELLNAWMISTKEGWKVAGLVKVY